MLYSILILCIILGRPIVFQDMFGRVFIIGDTVRPLGASGVSNNADDILALVDADLTVSQPNDYLFCRSEYRILQISSPKKRQDQKWLHQMPIADPCAVFMMKPWSREELLVSSFVIPLDQFACLQFVGCSWEGMTLLSSDFRKLPVFAGTYLVNVSTRQYLLFV